MKTEESYNNFIRPAQQAQLQAWLEGVKLIAPSLFDWVGIYFKESYLTATKSTDLILGPFLGEPTEHTRIPISRGICGMALREERVVNVADVRENSEHIACSLKTRSELVIPLKGPSGEFIAELDIDSNTLNAFSKELEEKVRKYSDQFVDLEL